MSNRRKKRPNNARPARMCAPPSCERITLREKCDKCRAAEAHETVCRLLRLNA
jgi:hypothetical protein